MKLPSVIAKIDLWPLHAKLLHIDIYGIEFLRRCCNEGNKSAMLLLGSHQFFNSPSPFTASGFLTKVSNGFMAQGVYNFAISQVCLRYMVGSETLFTMFDRHEPKKEIIIRCREAFRRLVLVRGRLMIPMGVHCDEEVTSRWDTAYSTVEGDKEHEVSCTRCSIDVDFYKLATGARHSWQPSRNRRQDCRFAFLLRPAFLKLNFCFYHFYISIIEIMILMFLVIF